MATSSSMNSTPPSSQAAISSSLIGREASAMSVSPAQKRAKPSPVPGPSTVMATSGLDSANAAAAAAEIGSTVDEPETTTSPGQPGRHLDRAAPSRSALRCPPVPDAAGSVPAGSRARRFGRVGGGRGVLRRRRHEQRSGDMPRSTLLSQRCHDAHGRRSEVSRAPGAQVNGG